MSYRINQSRTTSVKVASRSVDPHLRSIILINFLTLQNNVKAIERLAGMSREEKSTLNSLARVYSVIIQILCIIPISGYSPSLFAISLKISFIQRFLSGHRFFAYIRNRVLFNYILAILTKSLHALLQQNNMHDDFDCHLIHR